MPISDGIESGGFSGRYFFSFLISCVMGWFVLGGKCLHGLLLGGNVAVQYESSVDRIEEILQPSEAQLFI